jgi:hypothetical protein
MNLVWQAHQENKSENSLRIIMGYMPINLKEKLSKFSDHWSPKIIAQMNDYHFAEKECHIMLVEPAGTINTGSAGGDRTAADNVWI